MLVHDEYRKKLRTHAEAVKVIKSGDRVHLGTIAGGCIDLEAALAERANELQNVTLYSLLWSAKTGYRTVESDPNMEHFRLHAVHLTQKDRRLTKQGIAWHVPTLFHEAPKNWQQQNKLDVAFVMVAPMDDNGNFNLGATVADTLGIIKSADIVIAEVNDKMPRSFGVDNTINIKDIDMIVESSYFLPELIAGAASEEDKMIAQHLLGEINSGSCLQLGIGSMPNQLGKLIAQSDIKDLSIHSEMLCDCIVDLYEAGKISSRKNRDDGKIVFTFALGSQRLYDFMDNNPECLIAPVDYVNDIGVIASIDNFVSINSCLQVDIYGQVNAETLGFQTISGGGGQLGFVLGAYSSKNGKSFICTASTKTFPDGRKESLIVPYMPPGTCITCPRAAVHNIVTEYGIANIKGKSLWEKTEAIINIAHPDFREDLIKQAEKQGIWKNSSKIVL